MPRLVTLVLSVLICGLPAQAQQLLRRDDLRPADQALLETQAGEAAGSWRVSARAASGAVTSIQGLVPLRGVDSAARLDDLVARYGPLFDVGPGIELGPARTLRRHADGSARFVVLPQRVAGLPVVGHGLRVELTPEGDARVVRGLVSAAAAAVPPATLDDATAVALASRHLADLGHDPAAFRTTPQVLATHVDPLGRGLLPVVRVGVVVGPGYLPMAVDLDGRDGRVLAAFVDASDAGTGIYLADDGATALPFQTGTGKGVVYRSFKDATKGKAGKRPLKDLGVESVGQALDDSLFGAHAFVLEHTPADQLFLIGGDNHQFLGSPDPLDFVAADLFDATNCYYHLTEFGRFLTKLAGGTLPGSFAMPTLVNSPFVPFNAFFSSQDLGLGTGPGYLIFGDTSYETGVLADDLARDPSVMAHEAFHAHSYFLGLEFGTPPNHVPNRAVNEAIADYFAATWVKDPRVGLPLALLGSPEFVMGMGLSPVDGLRNLAAPLNLLDDLDAVLVDGLPEEHVAGHIFGASLWAVRDALKQKRADLLILDSLFNWPQTLAEIGYESYGPGNATQAYVDYYAECLTQLVLDAEDLYGSKRAGQVLGALMRHGGLGLLETDTDLAVNLAFGGNVTLDSAFLGSTAGHALSVYLEAGQTAKLQLKGDKKVGTQLDLDVDGPPGGWTLLKDPVVKGNSLKLPQILVTETGVYELRVLHQGPATDVPQPYRLQVKAQ